MFVYFYNRKCLGVKSPLWSHFDLVDGDFHLAECKYCGHVVRRGSENAPKSRCVNRTMQAQINKCQPDIMAEVSKLQAEMKCSPKTDVRNESVRGNVPLFKLTNREERAKFIKMVSFCLLLIDFFSLFLSFQSCVVVLLQFIHSLTSFIVAVLKSLF